MSHQIPYPPYTITSNILKTIEAIGKEIGILEVSVPQRGQVHYELEFIHPFSDGNGRMGRLWQQVLLINDQPIFEYLPVEEIIKKHQFEYYDVLSICDKEGDSTKFIEFSLNKILVALKEMPRNKKFSLDVKTRLLKAEDKFHENSFSRKEYAQLFGISSATASRDLLKGVHNGALSKEGDKALSRYKYIH